MLVRHHIQETYGVTYSLANYRRLLKKAGQSCQKLWLSAAEADRANHADFHDGTKKAPDVGRHRSLDRPDSQSIQIETMSGVVLQNSRPDVALSGQCNWMCIFDAVTDDGEEFFTRVPVYTTGDDTKHLILELCQEFRDDLLVVLDGVSYFTTSAVTDLAETRDDLDSLRFPAYSPT